MQPDYGQQLPNQGQPNTTPQNAAPVSAAMPGQMPPQQPAPAMPAADNQQYAAPMQQPMQTQQPMQAPIPQAAVQPLPPMQPAPIANNAVTAPAAKPGQQPQAPMPTGNPNSTQNALIISEIRDNMVIMNDGSMRAVVACRSINFDLMSDREREGIEYAYQQFLNSLYFPVQILIRSQKVDIGPYLERLSKVRRDQDNMLLGVLMDDYISFISALAQETNIMEKSFFVVLPYYPGGDMSSAVNSSKNFISALFAPQKQQHVRIDEATFNKVKDEIKNRVSTVVNGLIQMGIRSVQLTTKELGELYYNTYNPDTAVREPLGNFEDLSSPVVTKGSGNAPQPHLDRELL
ncbi:MAG TPA: hypothetical protein VLA88_06670 [Candidatus Saccharimonadales bacterium]|nr:hypothetical protein [Candidatus Saccharimonadales bacterium]